MIEQWEPLLELHLRFGAVQDDRIEVMATGCGSAESYPGLFPKKRAEFTVQTWVRFNGVGVVVPNNAPDPMAYALACLKMRLPKYQFAAPQMKQTKEPDGKL